MVADSKKNKGGSTWRNIPDRDRVILWGRAAARCCFSACRQVLIEPATDLDAEATYGQAAHIIAHSLGGPRANPNFPADKLDKYENLILLCGNHHIIVDRQPNTYTSDDLLSWKAEHEAWVLARTEPEQYVPLRWHVIIQEDEPQIDAAEAAKAVEPDVAAGDANIVQVTHRTGGWDPAVNAQKSELEKIISSVTPAERRFAVFSMTRIPLAIHFGYVLSDRCRVSLFQFHRDKASWKWPSAGLWKPDIKVPQWKEFDGTAAGPVVLRVSLSALVDPKLVQQAVPTAIGEVHLEVQNPSVTWLQEKEQLLVLNHYYRNIFAQVREKFGARCTEVSILYAGPVPAAIALGRAINPRMCPPIRLFEFKLGSATPYESVLFLDHKNV